MSDRPGISSVCVFCGSSAGSRSEYTQSTASIGISIAKRGWQLVYGGGHVGLMGVVADAAIANGGKVVGVITKALQDREVAHEALTELHVVQTMHERKAMMSRLSDAFIVLPGGIGTMEEFFEVWTWGQLGEHQKPIAILNDSGYFNPLINFFDHMVREKFLKDKHHSMLIVEENIEVLFEKLTNYTPPSGQKWIKPQET